MTPIHSRCVRSRSLAIDCAIVFVALVVCQITSLDVGADEIATGIIANRNEQRKIDSLTVMAGAKGELIARLVRNNMTTLETVNVFGKQDAGAVFLAISESRVVSIFVDDTIVDSRAMLQLQETPRVWLLVLGNARLDNKSCQHISRLAGLQVLDLDRTDMTVEMMRSLAQSKSIASLRLRENCVISPLAIRQIVSFGNLRHINLSGHQITIGDLMSIAQCQRCSSLILDNTSVTDAGLLLVATMPDLCSVSVKGTKVTRVGIEAVKVLKPLLSIEY